MKYNIDEMVDDVVEALESKYDIESQMVECDDTEEELEDDDVEDIVEEMFDYDKVDNTISLVVDGIDESNAKKILESHGIKVYGIVD